MMWNSECGSWNLLNSEVGMGNAERKGMEHRAECMEHSAKITEFIEFRR